MSLFERLRALAARAADTTRRQSRRARLEIECKRIESRINKEHARIGRSLLPSLREGGPGSDQPEVKSALRVIAGLTEDLTGKRAEIAALVGPQPSSSASD
jgi:hypothetical protein